MINIQTYLYMNAAFKSVNFKVILKTPAEYIKFYMLAVELSVYVLYHRLYLLA